MALMRLLPAALLLLLAHVSTSDALEPLFSPLRVGPRIVAPYPKMSPATVALLSEFRDAIPNGRKKIQFLVCDDLRFFCHANGTIKYIYLAGGKTNQLSGKIPAVIGKLTTLVGLFLQSNKFSGAIPDSIAMLKNLEFLNLHVNLLTGSIPRSLATLPKLRQISLYANFFSGAPPVLPAATTYYLFDNYLTLLPPGGVPPGACGEVYGNCLRGPGIGDPAGCAKGYQKGAKRCARFCAALQPGGICGGGGTCERGVPPVVFCQCFPGFNNKRANFTCVKT